MDPMPKDMSTAGAALERIIIPPEAIIADGDAHFVFLIVGDRIERRVVRLGVRTAGGQEILSGLQAGAILAVGNFAKLREGSRVCFTP